MIPSVKNEIIYPPFCISYPKLLSLKKRSLPYLLKMENFLPPHPKKKKIYSVLNNQIFSVYNICDALRDLVPFAQFKKREKHPLRSATLVLKVTLLHGCFSRFLNCTNCTKSRKASHIIY